MQVYFSIAVYCEPPATLLFDSLFEDALANEPLAKLYAYWDTYDSFECALELYTNRVLIVGGYKEWILY